MSDVLPEDAWVQSFLPSAPRPLLSSLQRRLQASTTHVNALAELYKQRAQIEAQYADSLNKLARSAEAGQLNGKQGVEWDKLGGEAKLWESVITDLTETSSAHSTFAALIKTDFEQPIRELPSKVIAWRRIADQDASLDKTLQSYEKTATKLEKASGKSKSGKADALAGELDQITQQLSSLSPLVYTTYQRLDEERLRTLKEMIVRWGTVRGDMAARDGERADRSVVGLIGWETGDEVLAVGRRLGGGGGPAPSSRAAQNGPPAMSSTNSTPVAVRRMSSVTNHSANDFSPRPMPRQNSSSASVTGGNTGFSGFKSMLGRKPTLALGKKGDKERDNRDRSGSLATSTFSRENRDRDGGVELLGDEIRPERGAAGYGGAPEPAKSSAPPNLVDDEGFSVPPPDRHRSLWEEPNDNIPTPTAQPLKPTPANPAGFGQTFTSSPSGSQENVSTPGSQPKLNLAIAPAPIQESQEERDAALSKMQQTLQAVPSQPTRRGTVARGRRDVRNTMFAGSGDSVPELGGTSTPPAGFGSPISPVMNGNSLFTSDRPAAAVRQASMSSVASNNPFDSPSIVTNAIANPLNGVAVPSSGLGLRASMTETLNVVMKAGVPQRANITGDVHLALRSSESSGGPIHIRLTAFEALEKIAPNPAYLAQVPEKPGEYFLNSETLASATSRLSPNATKGTLMFKYVVHVQPGKEAALFPLILEPVFSCKDGETRMILNYKPNPAFPHSSPISNLTLVASLEGPGPGVSNVQTKPTGRWSPSDRTLTWSIEDASQAGKIIARFATESGEVARPGAVSASFQLDNLLSSGLGLEVVDAQGTSAGSSFEEVKKGSVTGKYLAEPVVP